jgi:hypothetical protein
MRQMRSVSDQPLSHLPGSEFPEKPGLHPFARVEGIASGAPRALDSISINSSASAEVISRSVKPERGEPNREAFDQRLQDCLQILRLKDGLLPASDYHRLAKNIGDLLKEAEAPMGFSRDQSQKIRDLREDWVLHLPEIELNREVSVDDIADGGNEGVLDLRNEMGMLLERFDNKFGLLIRQEQRGASALAEQMPRLPWLLGRFIDRIETIIRSVRDRLISVMPPGNSRIRSTTRVNQQIQEISEDLDRLIAQPRTIDFESVEQLVAKIERLPAESKNPLFRASGSEDRFYQVLALRAGRGELDRKFIYQVTARSAEIMMGCKDWCKESSLHESALNDNIKTVMRTSAPKVIWGCSEIAFLKGELDQIIGDPELASETAKKLLAAMDKSDLKNASIFSPDEISKLNEMAA